MNNYESKCYQKTYSDPNFWDGVQPKSKSDRQQIWANCRNLTDQFYDELTYRGYLVRKIKP
ncbi:hypothetical protein PCC7424_1922 [Gloeothece citriformis PCC 7424]|uniref:Uncharacterized protein n=1 Tax=Gloeothece citriformis (strain PCC 7424) TaxID=65393 RepID=B7KDQ1_GLOC7|nr:hypothetical protein [Gloeothece citriformis]ACK70353.1 hypothetical protein PCC7424_1922 [Gloeothece citriformis PCC 7424]